MPQFERCGARHAADGRILSCLRIKNHTDFCLDDVNGTVYRWRKPLAAVEGAVKPGMDSTTPSYRPDAPSLHSLQRGIEALSERIDFLAEELAAEKVKREAQGSSLRGLYNSYDRFLRILGDLAADERTSE
jgi:hypothetical protein